MTRRLDIAWGLAALGFAIATVLDAQTAPAAPASTDLNVVPGDFVRSTVEGYVREQIEAADDGDGLTRYEVVARWQGDILLDNPGEVDFTVRRLSSRALRGPTLVRVSLLVDGEPFRTMNVTVDCRHYRDVLVTTRSVRSGQLLADAVEVEERDITGLKHGFLSDPAQLEGMRARRPIGVGDVITERHVEPVPVVHRGDGVVMSLSTDSMSLLTSGEALQDGGIGQRIRVRNVDSNKVVYGEVVDANTVRIAGD